MTDEYINARIKHHTARLRRAEERYQFAATHGTMEDMRFALAECQELRAKLIEYIARRDELTGGDNHAKNQR